MRWMWIDRFVEFVSGSHAHAVKNVSLAEEHLHDHFPGFPVMPPSLIIEGMAQTGGILLGEKMQFRHLVVLAKLPRMTFHSFVTPGESLLYRVKLVDVREEGGMVEATAHVGERLVAEGEIFYGHAGEAPAQQSSATFTNLLGVLEVGKAGNTIPERKAQS